jgi:hypothetical protein
VLLVVCGAIDGSFAQGISAPSTWVNQHKSILTIQKLEANGNFEGTYVNNAVDTDCIGDPYLVRGKIEADKIRFAVAFADRMDWSKNCRTVTQWGGTVSGSVMETNWALVYPGTNGLTLIGGSDTFELQP